MVWSRCRKLGDVLLILLCLSCAFISRVDAASRGSVPSQVNGQDPTQLNEADALVDAAFKLYERGQLEEALANATKAKKLNKTDFRPYAIAGLVLLAERKPENASKEFASAVRLAPKRKELHALKAKADASRGAINEAITSARKAL